MGFVCEDFVSPFLCIDPCSHRLGQGLERFWGCIAADGGGSHCRGSVQVSDIDGRCGGTCHRGNLTVHQSKPFGHHTGGLDGHQLPSLPHRSVVDGMEEALRLPGQFHRRPAHPAARGGCRHQGPVGVSAGRQLWAADLAVAERAGEACFGAGRSRGGINAKGKRREGAEGEG